MADPGSLEARVEAATEAMARNPGFHDHNAKVALEAAGVPALLAEYERLKEALERIVEATEDAGGHDTDPQPGACAACDALTIARAALVPPPESGG